VIGAGAKVLGAITIGANSRVGANAVVVKPVPPNSVVVGVPGQVVVRSKPRIEKQKPDLNHDLLPDAIGETLEALMAHVKVLEEKINGHANGNGHFDNQEHFELHMPDHGVWHGEDFSI
jgi:serine O-acetyltransferase